MYIYIYVTVPVEPTAEVRVVHLGGFEISFIYKLYVPVGDCNYEKEEKKKEKEKKEKGEEKKKEKKQGERQLRTVLLFSLLLARCLPLSGLRFFLRPRSPPSRFFSSSSLCLISSPASQSLSSPAPRFLILIFPKRFRALRRGWLPIRPLLPRLSRSPLLSHPRSPFILDHWILALYNTPPKRNEQTASFPSFRDLVEQKRT